MKLLTISTIITAAITVLPVAANADVSSSQPALSFANRVDQSGLLADLTKQIQIAPSDAANIVIAAIQNSQANAEMVAQIVTAAMVASPDQAESIAQAAVAIAPDAIPQIATAVAKLDGNNTDEVADFGSFPNPVYFPGDEKVIKDYLANQAKIDAYYAGLTDTPNNRFSFALSKVLYRFHSTRGLSSGSSLLSTPVAFYWPSGIGHGLFNSTGYAGLVQGWHTFYAGSRITYVSSLVTVAPTTPTTPMP